MTQILGAIILAAGAFLGVWKGAMYAADRLIAQMVEQRELTNQRLDAEAQRLQIQLDAESQRLDKQLAHDRWMREIDELRRLVDEAATAGLAAGNAIHDFRGQVRWQVETGEGPGQFYLPKRIAAQTAVEGMQGFVERFELRLGRGHELPGIFSRWQHTLEEAIEAFGATPPTKDGIKEGSERLKAQAGEYLKFMDVARGYVRLDPPDDR